MKKLLIINGPNLNLLGKREPMLYGSQSFESFFEKLKERFENVELAYVQCQGEGELVEAIHRAADHFHGVVLNPGAYTHTSIAVADAVRAVDIPVVEVHLSKVFAREGFRHKSFVSPVATGVISGMGLAVYRLALDYLSES